jgi:hypothetical protein
MQGADQPGRRGCLFLSDLDSAARRDIQPILALVYDRRIANSTLGVGCLLAGLLSIARRKREVVRDGYNSAIRFDGDWPIAWTVVRGLLFGAD